MESATSSSTQQIKVFGEWASSMTDRVKISLRLKGLQYEYVEEDPTTKSSTLLLHNPVYQQVPVLLHDGRAILEPTNIIQYIDETWNKENPILPSDSYERAVIRFWSHFNDDKLGPLVAVVFRSSGDDLAAAVKKVHENLKLLEHELREGFFREKRFFGGEKLGMLDIVVGSGSYWLKALDEVADVKLVDPEAFPLFAAWLRDFEEQEVVREISPAFDKLMGYARGLRPMTTSFGAQYDTADCDKSAADTSDTIVCVKGRVNNAGDGKENCVLAGVVEQK